VTGWESFEPWLSRVEQFDPQSLFEIVEAVPREWYGGEVNELHKLVEKLLGRRCRVRELISQFRDSGKGPFPNWKRVRSVVLPARTLSCRKKIDVAALASGSGLRTLVKISKPSADDPGSSSRMQV
jgi:hypothetical protein